MRYLLDISAMHLQDISCYSSFPRCLLEILNKPCLGKTIFRQNLDVSKLNNTRLKYFLDILKMSYQDKTIAREV